MDPTIAIVTILILAGFCGLIYLYVRARLLIVDQFKTAYEIDVDGEAEAEDERTVPKDWYR